MPRRSHPAPGPVVRDAPFSSRGSDADGATPVALSVELDTATTTKESAS